MRRARAAVLPIVRPDLVEFYLAHRAAQDMDTDHKVRWGARALLAAVPDLANFCRLPLERQLAFNHETHRFISWLSAPDACSPGRTIWSPGALDWTSCSPARRRNCICGSWRPPARSASATR